MGATINEDRFGTVSLTLSPAQVAQATTAEQTFTCKGLKVTDAVIVNKAGHDAGVMPIHARCSAADTLAITFANTTAGALTPTAAQTYYVHWFRAEKITSAVNV